MEMIKMGSRRLAVVLALAAMLHVVLFEGSRALDVCNLTEQDLETCRPAVTAPNPAPPTAECCGALQKADLACLCGYKNSWELTLLGIDQELALALPKKCNLNPAPGC